jgi:MFS family permease
MLNAMKLPLPIISLIVGALILLLGRRLFWLFVAAVGFAIGIELTPYLIQHPPPWLALGVAIILGILGAVLALVLQKIAIAIAGFLVGGHIATALVAAFVNSHGQYSGLTFIIGGIIGALLLLALFDWALIIFSSIAGAELVASNLHVPPAGTAILFIALTIFGIVVQAAMFARRRSVA